MARETLVLYENLRASAYTPFYLAQSAGLFEAEGLAAAYTRLKAALLAGGLIGRDVPYDEAVDAALSQPGAAA